MAIIGNIHFFYMYAVTVRMPKATKNGRKIHATISLYIGCNKFYKFSFIVL